MKVLIVEDEKDLRETVREYLQGVGYECHQAGNLADARAGLQEHRLDCILLDLNLPDGNGTELIPEIKLNHTDTGIIIITARQKVEDRIKGLEAGADDYVVKPFHLSELNARLKSLQRRLSPGQGSPQVSFRELSVYPDEKRCTANGKKLGLTGKELELLLYLISNKNRVLTRESIGERLWDGNYTDMPASLDFVYTHIKNLRKKMQQAGCGDYLKNVYGIGYKFTAE
jgi:DNA-binding response OmpR family regulator